MSKNPADYLAFTDGRLYLLECKSHAGKSFPLTALTQYDLMLGYANKKDVYPFVIVWLHECDTVLAVHISEIERMKNNDKKSISIKDVEGGEYEIIKIPSTKKRVFMDSDYTILIERGDCKQ